MNLPRLIRPFTTTPFITQAFGHNWPGVEPHGWLYADGSIGYASLPGAKYGAWHNGVDYGLSEGTALLAPGDGVIVWAGWDSTGFGIKVVVDHQNGWKSLLGHCRNIIAGQGSTVRQGDVVALSGSTGSSTGAHLHWSVIQENTYHFYPPTMFVTPPGALG